MPVLHLFPLHSLPLSSLSSLPSSLCLVCSVSAVVVGRAFHATDRLGVSFASVSPGLLASRWSLRAACERLLSRRSIVPSTPHHLLCCTFLSPPSSFGLGGIHRIPIHLSPFVNCNSAAVFFASTQSFVCHLGYFTSIQHLVLRILWLTSFRLITQIQRTFIDLSK